MRRKPTAREDGSRRDGTTTAAPATASPGAALPASNDETFAVSSGAASARRAILWGALAAATAVKLYLALRTAGTPDVAAYADFARKLRELGGVGLYHDPGAYSPYVYLPFGVHLLRLLDWLAASTSLPFGFWLRLPCALADAGSLLLVWRHFERATGEAATHDGGPAVAAERGDASTVVPTRGDGPAGVAVRAPAPGIAVRAAAHGITGARAGLTARQFASLLLLALNPVSIIVSGYHGNTDPVMIFFALLSVSLVDGARRAETTAGRRRLELAAGVAFGMALNVKIVPLIFVPAVWFYLADGRARLRFFGAVAATVFVASLPYVLQEPLTIARAVLGYGSLYGAWGWSYLLAKALPDTLHYARPPHGLYGPHTTYAAAGKWLAFATITAASFWMNRPPARGERATPARGPTTTDEGATGERTSADERPAADERKMTRERSANERSTDEGSTVAGAGACARPSLVLQCGLVMSIFLTLTPGFGLQYLVWIVPFVAALGLLPSLVFNVVAGYFVVVSYVCWFRKPPPAFCSTYDYPTLMLAAWFSIILLVFFHLRGVGRGPRRAATTGEARR